MVCRTLLVPAVDERACAYREPVSAVGVADLQDGTGLAGGLGNEQFEATPHVINYRQQRDRDRALRTSRPREAAAHLAVVDLERPDLGSAVGDARVARAI